MAAPRRVVMELDLEDVRMVTTALDALSEKHFPKFPPDFNGRLYLELLSLFNNADHRIRYALAGTFQPAEKLPPPPEPCEL